MLLNEIWSPSFCTIVFVALLGECDAVTVNIE